MLLAFKQITDTWVTYRNMNLRLNDLNQQRRSPIYSSFGETISGSSLIRAYKAEERFIADNFGRVDFNLKESELHSRT